MGQCTSTNGDDMVGPAGVACTRAALVPHPKPADGQRRSGSSSNGRRAAATGVEHHPASRNAPAALAPAVGGGGSGNGGVVVANGGLQRAGSSLSSEANSKHVQRLLASLSLLQALPAMYQWFIAQPALQPALLSVCQARWQAIRLGAHELYAQVRAADPASSPTLVFFQLFSDDLLRRCPELHVHLFGSAPLTPRTKPSLSAKLCSLVQTTIASFAVQSTQRQRKPRTTSANKRNPSSGLTSFDSVSECSELEPSTSASANPYHTSAAPEPAPAVSAAERKQRMASLWRQFNNAGINCEALGPFFTSLQNALATCFGVTEWRGTTALAWNTLCSTVIEQLIGVESTGAGAPTLISAPASNANADKASQHLSVMDKSEGPLSLMSSPRSHTGSQMGDTTDTVSRTGNTTGSQVYASSQHSAAPHHAHKPSASALALKPAAYKQRLDLASTASRVSRSGYTQSSDAYSPRSKQNALQLTLPSSQLTQSSAQPMQQSAPSQSQQLQQQLQLSNSSQALPQNALSLSLSMASPFSQSGASVSQSATPVRRMPSALAAAAVGANALGNGNAAHTSIQSMSLGLSPLIQLPGQTPSPTTPAQAAAPAPGSRQNSRPGTADAFDDTCECGAPDCKRCAEADAFADDDSAPSSAEPLDAETMRALRETAALDPAQELARFAFHPKPPAKPKVVYMSGLELPPALLAADPATAALIAAADRRAAVYGRSLFGLSRVQPSAQAVASAGDMTALALLTSSAARVAAHTHNHALSRNHSHSRSGHSNSRAPASSHSAASASATVPSAVVPSAVDMSTSSNLSLVSRSTNGSRVNTNANPNANTSLPPVVSVSA